MALIPTQYCSPGYGHVVPLHTNLDLGSTEDIAGNGEAITESCHSCGCGWSDVACPGALCGLMIHVRLRLVPITASPLLSCKPIDLSKARDACLAGGFIISSYRDLMVLIHRHRIRTSIDNFIFIPFPNTVSILDIRLLLLAAPLSYCHPLHTLRLVPLTQNLSSRGCFDFETRCLLHHSHSRCILPLSLPTFAVCIRRL